MEVVVQGSMSMSLSIVFMGFLVGFLVGLTGVGGAALLTPVLVFIGVNPSIAVGTDLFYNSITKFFGAIQHWRQKSINFTLVRYFSLGSIPSAIIAITIINFFDFQARDALIKHALGYVLIAVSLSMLFQLFFASKMKPSKLKSKGIEEKRLFTIGVGAVFGFIVGLTSIGAGSLFAVAMFFFYRISAAELVGTDIAHAFVLVTVAGLLNIGFGHVDFFLAGNLLIGSIPGVLLGSRLTAKVSATMVRTVMATIILISGLKIV